jgi:hypothetical protein
VDYSLLNGKIRQLDIEYPPLNIGDEVVVTRYSGQTMRPKLLDFGKHTAVLDYGEMIGYREVWLTTTRTRTAGKFKSAGMRDWSVDVGTLERLKRAYRGNHQ